MKKLKRALRLLAFIGLVVLASLGVGLCGGIPIPTAGRKDDKAEVFTALDNSEKEEESTKEKI